MKRRLKVGGMSRFHLIPSVFIAIAILACPVFADTILYVDDDAPMGGDGLSWQTAFEYLQDALESAKSYLPEPVEIRVAQGLYQPDRNRIFPNGSGDQETAFTLLGGMRLRGGYLGHKFAGLGNTDPNTQDPKLYPTILSADLAGNDVEIDYLRYTGTPWTGNDEPATRVDNAYAVMRISHFVEKPTPFPDVPEQEVLVEGCEITGGYGSFSVAGIWGASSKVSMTIRDCSFYGNFAIPTGDAGPLAPDIALIERCTFERNGGYYSPLTGAQTVKECKFIRNHTIWGSGGGAYGAGTFIDCVFVENLAPHGGALRVDDSVIKRCIFIGNRAISERGWGGGVLAEGNLNSVVKISDCIFVDNYARESVGACGNARCRMTLTNCLVVGNRAGKFGGAFRTAQGTLELTNCTVVGNRAPNGSFLVLGYDASTPRPSQVEMANCIISNEDCSIWNNDSTVVINYTNIPQSDLVCHDPEQGVVWGEGNIDSDPLFVDPGHWDANGTPNDANDDVFVEGDYHLKSQGGHWDDNSRTWIQDDVTSPCIDAGDPNSPIGLEPFPNGGIINMGAYGGTDEASKSYFGEPPCETIIAGDINGDCKVNFEDLRILVDHWLHKGSE